MLNSKTYSLKKRSNRSAFSLIELSIVLIIIGLLIAGVTGGASLIKSAELRSLMNEARGYNVAVNSFYTQFDQLPGDFAIALAGGGMDSGSGEAGDENSRIEYVNARAGTGVVEGVSAWQQLSAANVINDTLAFTLATNLNIATTTVDVAATCGTQLPNSKAKGGCWVFDYIGTQSVVILTAGVGVGVTQHNVGTPDRTEDGQLSGVITPSDAFSIDTKVDDGLANGGNVRNPFVLGTACTTVAAGPVYDFSITTRACPLTFSVDVL